MTWDITTITGACLGLLVAFVVHEYAHAKAAYSLGDPTSKYAGRLTLNPLVHLDPIGSIALLLSALSSNGSLWLGWAKPVLFNRDNFKQPYLDGALVALAGPLSNLFLAFLLAVPLRFAPIPLLALVIKANVGFGLFNAFPLPPLDGWKILMAFVPKGLAAQMDLAEQRLGKFAPVLLLAASFLFIAPLLGPLTRSLNGLLTP
jgi:Zn-dependent protease